MKPSNNKDGGILVMVTLVLLVFSVLAIGLFKLHLTDAVEAVYVEQSNQAFWIAESGVQRALNRLRTDAAFRNSPNGFSETIGEGENRVHVDSKAGVDSTWSIISTGTVGSVSRIIVLDPFLTAEAGYAIMGLNGDSTLNKDGSIEGNIYNFGELWVNGRATPSIDGEVLALDTRNIDEYKAIEGNDQVQMSIDASDFDFSFDASYETTPTYTNIIEIVGTVTNTYNYLDLTGNKTLRIEGDYELGKLDGKGEHGIIGDGTLIVAQDISGDASLTFSSAGKPDATAPPYIVGDYADIWVQGDILAKKEGVYGVEVLVYSAGDMKVSKTGAGAGTTFLVEGDFTADKDLDLKGLIFVDGNIQIDGNLTLEGTLIAGQDFWLKGDYDIIYNADYIPQDVLDNMILYVIYSADPGSWDEVSAF